MTRRDLATVGCCGLLVAAVAVLARRHPVGDREPSIHSVDDALLDSERLERAEGLPEMRRVVQYMLAR